MPVDYAALARKFGGTVVEDDEPDYSSLASMRPMVAHTPRGKVVDFAALAKKFGGEVAEDEDVGTLNEEPRTPPIGIDPRLEPESVMNAAQAAEVPGQVAGGLANYATMASAPSLVAGGRAIVSGAARSRLRPIITGAAVGAGQAVLSGGDVTKGAIAGAVLGAAGSGASAGRTAAKTAARTAATEAVPDAAALLKVARSAAATTAERKAARTALVKMGWVPGAEKTFQHPVPGNVKPATVYTRPEGLPPQKSEAVRVLAESGRRNLKAEQLEAAKEAGMDLAETFGATTKAVSRGHQVAAQHKALMTLGKAAATRNPKIGEKIWMLLDDAGNPVEALTPAQAGAAARKGLKTTWVKNLWTN